MIGYGKIFKFFSFFHIEEDDEVAQIMSPFNFSPLSLALVDIRFFMKHLLVKNLILRKEYECVVQEMKDLFYADRNINSLKEIICKNCSGRNIQATLSELKLFKSQKKIDAINIIKKLNYEEKKD